VLVKDVKQVEQMVMVEQMLHRVEVEQVVQVGSIQMAHQEDLGEHKEVMVLELVPL
jgi:hypothetical protein